MVSCIAGSPGPTGAQGVPGVDGVNQAEQEAIIRDLAGGAAECNACHTPFRQGEYDGEKCYVGLLNFSEYQSMAHDFALYDQSLGPIYSIVGLVGEAGELANKWKKVWRDDKGVLTTEKKEALVKELGDVLWYAAELATSLGYSLEHVAQANINNLCGRRERNTLMGSGDNR